MDLEFDRDGFPVGIRGLEKLLLGKAKHASQDVGRKRLNLGVEIANDRVVIASRVLDRILGLAESALQLAELLRRFQFRVVFCHREQALQSTRKLIFRNCFVCGARCLHRLGTKLGDVFESALFVRCVAFHRLNKIRDKVVTSFELDVDVRPG